MPFAVTRGSASTSGISVAKVRASDNAVWVAYAIHLMAGAEACRELLGTPISEIGDDHDRRQIGRVLEEELVDANSAEEVWVRKEARLRKMTRMLIRRHRGRIERVAEALLAKTTVSAEELDKLVGRSVNDVKVNAPILLALHREQQDD
jgi:hypothetical protein